MYVLEKSECLRKQSCDAMLNQALMDLIRRVVSLRQKARA